MNALRRSGTAESFVQKYHMPAHHQMPQILYSGRHSKTIPRSSNAYPRPPRFVPCSLERRDPLVMKEVRNIRHHATRTKRRLMPKRAPPSLLSSPSWALPPSWVPPSWQQQAWQQRAWSRVPSWSWTGRAYRRSTRQSAISR